MVASVQTQVSRMVAIPSRVSRTASAVTLFTSVPVGVPHSLFTSPVSVDTVDPVPTSFPLALIRHRAISVIAIKPPLVRT